MKLLTVLRSRKTVALLMLALCFSMNSVTTAQVRLYGLGDFDEIGQIDDLVQPVISDLNFNANELEVSFNFLNAFFTSVGLLSPALLAARQETSSALLIFISGSQNVVNAFGISDPESQIENSSDGINSVVNSLSVISTSVPTERLNNVVSDANTLISSFNGNTITDVSLVTANNLIAVARISVRARNQMSSKLSRIQTLRTNLSRSLTRTRQVLGELSQYNSNLSAVIGAISGSIRNLSPLADTVPLLAVPLIQTLQLASLNINRLRQDVGQAIDTVETVRGLLEYQRGKLGQWEDALEAALSVEMLTAQWQIGATITDPDIEEYEIKFLSSPFETRGYEINGSFVLGSLNIENKVSFGQNNEIRRSFIRFFAQRTIQDPFWGRQFTEGFSPEYTFTYTTTPNVGGNCGPSRDFFSVNGGIATNLFICENEQERFIVRGSYASPLKITTFEAAPDSNDSDPAVTETTTLLEVIDGTGSGVYAPGESVPISPLQLDGKTFVGWEIIEGDEIGDLFDPNQADTLVVLNASYISIRGMYRETPKTVYIDAQNSDGSGVYEAGAVVILEANNTDESLLFDRWVGDTDEISDVFSSKVSVVVDRDIEVTAVYKDAPTEYLGIPIKEVLSYVTLEDIADFCVDSGRNLGQAKKNFRRSCVNRIGYCQKASKEFWACSTVTSASTDNSSIVKIVR